jgi:6-phosphogluconolactonase (cycloisomerase 2 family)
MKLSKYGRIALALAASLFIGLGTQSCYYYTEAYIIVTGSQYNQVASYREQNQTGVLTGAPGNPLSSGGTNPVRAALLPGGRYVYVLNEGKASYDSAGNITWSGNNISLFSIGGDGGLSYQLSYPSQGLGSLRLALNTGGNVLYVLDTYQPGSNPNVTAASPTYSAATPCKDAAYNVYRPAGDITAYSIDGNTGRLFLLTNQQQTNSQGSALTYFPIGCGAIDFHLLYPYLYTGEASDPASGQTQVVYPYQVSTNGQLVQVPGGAEPVGTTSMSFMGQSANGNYVYILDNGSNSIFIFTPGGNGLLSAIATGAVPNTGGSGMTGITTDSQSKYVYVTNAQSTGLGQAGSIITAYEVIGGGTLEPLPTSLPTGNLFATGGGPQCIFQDPSHQYIYTAGSVSSQITGAAFDPNTGILRNLSKGSSFSTVGTPTWCLYSSNTD